MGSVFLALQLDLRDNFHRGISMGISDRQSTDVLLTLSPNTKYYGKTPFDVKSHPYMRLAIVVWP